MALLDDDDAFEAALAFLEEYEFEETKTEELDSLSGQDEAVQTLQEGSDSFYSHVPQTPYYGSEQLIWRKRGMKT
ncbi:hypothetical protein Pcac1_g10695 [Phytophthora cactorum]|nr:hypothetical protein Pcac1_g10695 [Phytophthora cactorum]